MTRYLNDHWSQFDPRCSAITHSSGCTWTSGANGVDAVTGGRHKPTPDAIHALVKRTEETAPTTPGWSLTDLDLALSRYGMGFEDHTGEGWAAAEKAHDEGRYVVLQGDSDQFPDSTCSGNFEGDHCIGVHPRSKIEGGAEWWWIDDPICPEGRWAKVTVLRRYAEKLWASVRFGVFTQKVPTWRWIREPLPGRDSMQVYVFTVTDGVIRKRTTVRWKATDVSCTAPEVYPWPGHRDKRLVRLTGGVHDGKYVHARRARLVTPQ